MSESTVLDAGERLRRLLAVLAYLSRVGEASLTELSERFDMDRATLVKELELASCCGLPPYTPDQLLELVIDDEHVMAFGLDVLRRPPRLTADEGFAVAAAARALLSVHEESDDSPLQRALAKLEAALGNAQIDVELDSSPHFDVLRKAAVDGEIVEIDYLGKRRGEETTRAVEAYAVVVREGHLYLDGYCHLAGDWRRFQLDRIAAVRPTGEHGQARTPPPELTGTRAFSGGESTRTAYVAVPKESNFLVERFAAGPGEEDDKGRLVVPVEVGSDEFLGRLMLRLGAAAELVGPDDLRGVAADVAQRALERYKS